MSRGRLVVIEGIDRCGKTSQATRLVESLRSEGREVDLFVTPDRDLCAGRAAANLLTGEWSVGKRLLRERGCVEWLPKAEDVVLEAALLACRYQVASWVEAARSRGIDAVCVRWRASGILYARRFASSEVATLAEQASEFLPDPDVSVLIRPDVDEVVNRLDGGERFERDAVKQTCLDLDYQEYWNDRPLGDPGRWVVVDGTGSPEVVAARLREAVRSVWP
jgi:dTMP kinase